MNTKNLSLLLSKTKRFKIQDKAGKSMYFEPNIVQRKVLKKIISTFESGKKVRLIIIKGRQQGISTLMSLIGLALSLKIPGYKTYMMTHERDLATDIFENKIKFAWDQLPENFKSIYRVNRNNARQLLFDDEMQKSSITVGLKGRGGTFQFIHISEPGKMSTSKSIWNEMKSGLLPAGEFADAIIWESTADGGLGEFYETVQENLGQNSEYEVLFLSWLDSPEYQLEPPKEDSWREDYKRLVRDYKLEPDPMAKFGITENQLYWYYQKAKQLRDEVKVQYPFTLDEAFISLAQNYFSIQIIQEALAKAQRVEYKEWRGFKIFRDPVNHVYAVGADCATGENNDNTSIHVYDAQTGEQVAVASGKFDEPTTAKMMMDIGYFYNEAYIAPEINNMGRAVMYFLLGDEYPNDKLYKRIKYDPSKQKDNRLGSYGWLTSSVSRPVLLADFRNSFEDGTLKINDVDTLKEMLKFVNNNGKYEAEIGSHDDRVLGAMIGYQVIKYIIDFG